MEKTRGVGQMDIRAVWVVAGAALLMLYGLWRLAVWAVTAVMVWWQGTG